MTSVNYVDLYMTALIGVIFLFTALLGSIGGLMVLTSATTREGIDLLERLLFAVIGILLLLCSAFFLLGGIQFMKNTLDDWKSYRASQTEHKH
ncbi:hypothetical protein N7488_001373 [Penicillium malachiteum]|nr:hypothetical protein N7488_001373 [Penicillium malachiteum]